MGTELSREELVRIVAFALHDQTCADRCEPVSMGSFFVRAESLVATVEAGLREQIVEEIENEMSMTRHSLLGGLYRAAEIVRSNK